MTIASATHVPASDSTPSSAVRNLSVGLVTLALFTGSVARLSLARCRSWYGLTWDLTTTTSH